MTTKTKEEQFYHLMLLALNATGVQYIVLRLKDGEIWADAVTDEEECRRHEAFNDR